MIGILTDFGEEDQYVFQMKSVIKRINPNAAIYDITHQIRKFDIWEGSFILTQAAKYVPAGSILIAVVDPGVATRRKAIAVKTGKCILIGPDNGLLYEAASYCGIDEIRQISSEKVILKKGSTFDGRDVFAPAAAHLSLNMKFSDLGPELSRMEKFEFPRAEFSKEKISASVLHVDHFGNSVLNVNGKDFVRWSRGKKNFYLRVGCVEWSVQLHHSYSGMKEIGLIIGSTGLVEVSSFEGGAPEELMKRGENVVILK